MMGEADDEALKALYNRHSDSDYDSDEQARGQLFKDAVAQVFGIDLDDEALDDPAAATRQVSERLQGEEEARAGRAGRRKTARQTRMEAEQAQASQSVRDIYRKLASALHPDRETDMAERERKTALMQRVNQAYAKGSLLDLLQLQLEVEQIDLRHMAGLAEDRLKAYNRVLGEQLKELQGELQELESAFKEQFQLDPCVKVGPKNLERMLGRQLKELHAEVNLLKLERELLEDPKALKRWLKAQAVRVRAARADCPCHRDG